MSIPRFAVIGHPVAHSLSPRIHAAFGRQLGIALEYVAIDAAPEQFDALLAEFAAEGGLGANITLPHKTRAAGICSHLSERARRAGAANTLIRSATGWEGDNTDGVGLVRDLTERHGLDLRERRTLLIGAGGAARGVAPALLDAGIGDLYIVNRTPERADALADALGQPGRVHPRYLKDAVALGAFDLIVNATSAARDAQLPSLPMGLVTQRTAAVDLSYGEVAIPFLAWAKAAGAHDRIDGLGMLVEQAAESFERWHRVRPETDPVYAALRERDDALVTAD
ncbi:MULTISPECIES: shikimate dehydrogenase [unclassified Lysobacter]|uniref:shikimate dehydrogenase n=1 Tax=unclassified Lysobacter TaxID=2635362 RepID=UPI0006F55637|nr:MULTISPECIES: shikimate dehydrogenase [unclassified Lysobacter]KRA17220.1 shikimate dehydrogenase [Lysobacter sp. Root604]KRD76900.1 shikimate dehydrogenase [Lysobacter sp. Root983]